MISRILALIVAAALISGCDPTSAAGICDVDRGFDEVPWLVGDSGVATPIRCPGEHPAPGRGRVAIVDEPETGWVVCGCYHDADEDGQHDQGEAVAPADTLFSYERQSVRYDLILNSCADLEQQCERRYIGGAATTVKPYAVQPLLGVNPAGPFVAASSCQVVPLFDLVQKAACSLEVMREATVPRRRCDSGANRALRCLQKYPRVYFGNSDPRAPCRALADDLGGWRLGTLELADDCVNEAEWIAQVTTADSGVWANVVQCVDDGVRGGLEFERSNPDHDRVCSDIDNCDDDPNDDQVDCDNDGRGNLCDDDRDGDGVPDVTEEDCGTLHRCASDFDGDNLEDLIETLGGEKCPDSDNDGTNDVVDKDSDNDGLDDGDEAVGTCANGLDPYRVADCDGDGVLDPSDNCPLDANPTDANNSQVDLDGDGKGDLCDDDRDGDGDDNADDNCPDDANPDQADLDGDGIGEACDLNITIAFPFANVPAKWPFSTVDSLLRREFTATVDGGQPLVPDRDELVWTLEPTSETNYTWTPPAAAPPIGFVTAGSGLQPLLEVDGFPRGAAVLPPSPTAFGAKLLTAEAFRRGIRTDVETRDLSLYWPNVLVDPHRDWTDLSDADYAKNHPGDDDTVFPQHFWRSVYDVTPSRAPNWFYYWLRLRGPNGGAHPFDREMMEIIPRYAVMTHRENVLAFYASGSYFDASIGMPNNIVYFGDWLVEPDSSTRGVRAFFAILVHEHCHVLQNARWSTQSRAIRLPVGHPSRVAVTPGAPVSPDDWSWTVSQSSPASTRFVDIDGNDEYTQLSCDLNSNGVTDDVLLESEIVVGSSCGGSVIAFRDFDRDGELRSLVSEMDVESLDGDDDALPNWEEDPVVAADPHRSCDEAQITEMQACDGPDGCRFNELAELDWGSPGEQY